MSTPRRSLTEGGLRTPAQHALLVASGLALAGVLGALTSPHRRTSILLGGASLVVALLVTDPLLIPALALPGALLLQRLGGSAAGSSVDLSDVILLTGVFVSLPLVRWSEARGLRRALPWAFLYTGLALPSVLLHPNSHAWLEWFHRILLVQGALVVGWVVASAGKARQAFTIFALAAIALALFTLELAVSLHFKAAQSGSYQKNYIGAVMYMAIIITHLNPDWVGLDRRLARTAKYLCVLALLATQSKQSIIALVAAFAVALLRDADLRRRSKTLIVAVVPLAVFAYVVAAHELATYHHHFNSVKVRTIALADAMTVWHLDPWFGQGPHWFYLPQFFGIGQPPNIAVDELTSTGIVGLAGLVLMLGGLLWVLLRLPRAFGTLAAAILLARVVESIFDLFWVSAVGMLPFLLAGMALGAADLARLARAKDPPLAGLITSGS